MEKDVNLLEELKNLNDLENNLHQLDGLLKGFVPLLTKNKQAMIGLFASKGSSTLQEKKSLRN